MEIGSEDTVLATAVADDYYYDNDLLTAEQLLFFCSFIVLFLSLQLGIKRFAIIEPTIFDMK